MVRTYTAQRHTHTDATHCLFTCVCLYVCVYAGVSACIACTHANMHVQACACVTNQLPFQGFPTAALNRPGLERVAQLKTLMTDDISRDQTDSAAAQPPKCLERNIYMAGLAFLINHSVCSRSARQGAGFEWPCLSQAHF